MPKLEIIPPRNRGYITDNTTGVRTEITKDITNWNDLEIKHVRNDFSGVYVTVGTAIEVCRKGKALVQNAFHAALMAMNLTFEIMRRGPKDFIYVSAHKMRLKPGTYEEHREYLSIEGQALIFDSLVKSVGKTKYDILVMDVIDEYWQYKHNQVFAGGYYTMAEAKQTMIGLGSEIAVNQTLSINLDDPNMPLGGIENDFRSQGLDRGRSTGGTVGDLEDGPIGNLPAEYFFMVDPNLGAELMTFRLRFKFDLSWNGSDVPRGLDGTPLYYSPRFFLHYTDPKGDDVTLINRLMSSVLGQQHTISFDYDEELSLPAGAKLRMFIFFDGAGSGTWDVEIKNFVHFNITYLDKSRRTDTIPAVTPQTLANALLSKMANGDAAKTYTVEIDADTDNPWSFNHYLVAAESIRGFEKANFHASFNDFIEYMSFLGYEYEVDEDARVVHFRKRAYFFNPNITALSLKEEEVANVVIKGNDDYAYSTVRVGYEKPDIENTNGRFAICGAFDYSTDFSNLGDLKDTSKEIMCPYKADPVEIETLSWTRGEKTTDQKADNDIFMLAGEVVGDHVEETRQAQYVVTDDDLPAPNNTIGWYNVPYIPHFITKRHTGIIGVAVKNLTFTGTDAFRDAKLSGVVTVDPYSSFTITDGLFLPMTYEFDAGTSQGLPPQELRSGLVRFVWNGKRYQGYIKQLTKTLSANKGEAWELHAR